MSELVVRELGFQPLRSVWNDMKDYTERRGADDPDEIWFVEHAPVFTLGLAGDESHLLDPGDIEIVKIDRGGQVTYHGPGQLVCYTLLDLRRRALDIRTLVAALETAVVDTAAELGVDSYPRRDARGVYVDGRKLAAIGLRVRRGCSYHGLALNVAMDLSPFGRINPCGYAGLEVTQLSDLCSTVRGIGDVRPPLERHLRRLLSTG